MHALKEKVADKLSRILADSPSSPSHFSDDSPVSTPKSEGSLLSKKERYGSERSLSAYLLSFIPSSSSNGNKANKRRQDLKPSRSLSSRWRSKSFTWRDKPLEFITEKEPECPRNEASETCNKVEEDHHALRNINVSNKCEETSTSQISVNCFPNLSDESSFISSDLQEFLHSTLPNIVKGCQWVLLYSTLKHGISLRTLLRKSGELPGPCLLIVGDMQGAVFGGLLECPLKPTAKRKYQGTNQTFVFTTIYGQPRLFRATGANRYYYICLNDLLAIGGGGNFALCLDGDLLHGTSGPCETFGNLCLANSPEFELKNVELWGFRHSSKYLN
ncbi:hypothetical protein MKW92_030222 [Papaver armeniacum]|nr:hypothetical protein MKW92_030222 [Papaver armeniacum]